MHNVNTFELIHVNKVLFPQVIDIFQQLILLLSWSVRVFRQIHVSHTASVDMKHETWMVQQAVEGLAHLESYHQSTEHIYMRQDCPQDKIVD